MRRQEKRKGWIFIFLAVLLVLTVPISFARLCKASEHVDATDVVDFSEVYPVILDSMDRPIYENETISDYEAFGNTVGLPDSIHNSLSYLYADELAPSRITPVLGHLTVEDQSRVMKTTLLTSDSQQILVDAFKGKRGCVFAYNYETGEIYTSLSFPYFSPNYADAGFQNRCFTSLYIPGSTMKVVTTALAADQGLDLSSITHTCNGSKTLPDGEVVYCTGIHGTINFSQALGQSCNCYFAHVASLLDLDQALKSLESMGFAVNGAEIEKEYIDRFTRTTSSVDITNTATFSNVWSFIGQGTTEVNPCEMAMIAAAVVNNGKTAVPYMVSSITNPNKSDKTVYSIPETVQEVSILSPTTAKLTKEVWKKGVDAYYYAYQGLSDKIDYAKTGTAEQTDGSENKLLIGTIEKSKTAFYIVVEDYQGDVKPVEIANKLAEILPTA